MRLLGLTFFIISASTPLRAGSDFICRALLARGVAITAEQINLPHGTENPLIHDVLLHGDWDALEVLLELGGDPLAKDHEGRTLYQVAYTLGVFDRLGEVIQNKFPDRRAIDLRAVRYGLNVLGYQDFKVGLLLATAPSVWFHNFRVQPTKILKQSIALGSRHLIRFLLEVKGIPLPPDPRIHYRLWAFAILDDSRSLFPWLNHTDVPLVHNDKTTTEVASPLALAALGHTNIALPGPYSQGPVVPNLTMFEHLLDRGADETADPELMRQIAFDPDRHRQIWKLLFARRPSGWKLCGYLNAIARHFPEAPASSPALKRWLSAYVAAGGPNGGMPAAGALAHAATPQMTEWLVTQVGIVPPAAPMENPETLSEQEYQP